MDLDQVMAWMHAIIEPDQLVELRALKVQDGKHEGGSTWSGHFRGHEDLRAMCEAALRVSGYCQGVYFTLNPIRPEKFVRKTPRLDNVPPKDTATDADIVRRQWVMIDVDPKRARGKEKQSANDSEKAASWSTLDRIRQELAGEGWPAPFVGDSGNGFHLMYKMEPQGFTLPLSEGDELKQLLRSLADRFDSESVEIDRKVYNPARICKFPGTLAMKGDGSGDRPHRTSRIIEVPT